MFNVVAAELRKMKRPSIVLSTFAIIGTLSIGMTGFIFLSKNKDTWAVVSKFDGPTYSYSMVTSFMGYVALTIFASQTAQEYTFGTLRNLLVRQPNRIILFLGKYLAMTVFAILFVLFTFILNVGLSYILAKYQHLGIDSWSSTKGLQGLSKLFFKSMIAMIGFGSFGMALGMILKSPLGAISASLLWFLVVEGLLGAILKGATKWLPGNALMVINDGGMTSLPFTRGLLIAATYVIALMSISGYLFHTRDVAQ